MTSEQTLDASLIAEIESKAPKLSRTDRENLIACLMARVKRHRQRRFFLFYPDTGPLRRELYQKHLEFFRAGAKYRERCFMAANRVGKTEGAGGYELTCHLTGYYPPWWEGRRFTAPVRAWAAGRTNETTRDIVQKKLLGEVQSSGTRKNVDGTGMIPGEWLGKPSWKQGVPDLVDTVPVRYQSGGWSTLGMKSYQQGRSSFEGTEQHVIWLDEEPPMDVYGECLIRTATTDGVIMLTFTPLTGLSVVVLQFMPAEFRPDMED